MYQDSNELPVDNSDIYDITNTSPVDAKTAKNLMDKRGKASSTGSGARSSLAAETANNLVQGPHSILELARALRNDPQLIFQWVYQNIEFTPINGVQKGVSCIIDGYGTAFDQSALLIALLRQAAINTSNAEIIEANFVHGTIQLTFAQCQAWLGIEDDIETAWKLFSNGGFLPTIAGTFPNQLLEVKHCWVQLKLVGDFTYVLDPSFKSYERVSGLSDSELEQWMGYTDVATFMTGATSGSGYAKDPGGTWVQNVNTANINTQLSDLSTNLIAAIKKHNSDWNATLDGAVTPDDVVTITVYNAGLTGGKKTVSYTVQAGDTTIDAIATGLANAINADGVITGVGVSAVALSAIITLSNTTSTSYISTVSEEATVTIDTVPNQPASIDTIIGGKNIIPLEVPFTYLTALPYEKPGDIPDIWTSATGDIPMTIESRSSWMVPALILQALLWSCTLTSFTVSA